MRRIAVLSVFVGYFSFVRCWREFCILFVATMNLQNPTTCRLRVILALAAMGMISLLHADQVIRIMAANTTSGNGQSYDPGEGNRIFRGLAPDIALVQETNIGTGGNKNTPATYRAWVDANFGPAFFYRVETGVQLPNSIISRFPILSSGIWDDPEMTNREFIWAKIDIPGDKDLWAISVHISSGGGASVRQLEAVALRNYISANIPPADYLVLAGDLNTNTRSEQCISTLSAVLNTASPYPADQAGNSNTNASRAKPYDWVIPDADLTARATPLVIGTRTFPNGLVYDSTLSTPYSLLPPPILAGDSGATNMQHMAVMRAFLIPTNDPPTIAAVADSSSTETVMDPNLKDVLRGTSVGLSVIGADDAGEPALKYTWSVTSGVATAVSFSANGTNAAKNSGASFTASGDYTLTASVQDALGLRVTSSVHLRVLQTATALAINPASASLPVDTNIALVATLRDQFDQTMPGVFTWSVTGGGTIDPDGLFSAATVGGPFSAVATSGSLSARASLTVKMAAVVTLDPASLTQTYDGDPKIVTATTTPPGLAVTIRYNGSLNLPASAGVYSISATTMDADYQGAATGSLTITPDAWALWKNTYFTLAERTAGLADDPADSDSDGLTNLAEYALDTDPRAFTPQPPFVLDGRGLTVTFTRPQGLPGIIYGAQASSDLSRWSPIPLAMVSSGSVETMAATDPPPSNLMQSRFMRLTFKRE